MRKKYVKYVALGLLSCILVGSNAYASVSQSDNDVKFSKHFIDDTTFTTVTTGKKINENRQLRVKVTEMYDENGTVKENWERTIWKVNKDGQRFSAETVVQKDVITVIELDQIARDTLTVKCHGNTEGLDARISGLVYNFTKS